MAKPMTINNFVEKANNIHNNKYDYSNVNYINNYSKVCIICPIHGEFWQQPSEHLKGFGCKLCSDNSRRKTTEEYIKEAHKIHGNKYDYSKVKYKNNKEKICIICKDHGEFWQQPIKHLKGQGCPHCKHKAKTKITVQDFINRCNLLYDNKYDYSKVAFTKLTDIITIICPIHGEFLMDPRSHIGIYGKGCPKCGHKLPLTNSS